VGAGAGLVIGRDAFELAGEVAQIQAQFAFKDRARPLRFGWKDLSLKNLQRRPQGLDLDSLRERQGDQGLGLTRQIFGAKRHAED